MNQGKLEVDKQKMTRVNVDILGISELKWTGMGGKSHGQRSLVGYSPWGRKELYTTEKRHWFTGSHYKGKSIFYSFSCVSVRDDGWSLNLLWSSIHGV